MAFNLKNKLLAAKERVTGVLATGVIVLDAATTNAIESAAETVNGVTTAAKRRVDNTVTAIKDTTNEKLGQLGDAVDARASKVSAAAAEFGKAAKRKLGGKPEPVVVEAKKKRAPAKITANKRKPAQKKPSH